MSNPNEGGYVNWLNAVKGLTISNVLVIGMLMVIAVPVYFVYRTLNDNELLDRFLSTYREVSSQNVGCTIRNTQLRGQSENWSISTGFAFQGADRYVVSVVLSHMPSDEELYSYCEALKLIVDVNFGRE